MAGALRRWDPFAEINHVRAHFDRLFDGLGRHSRGPFVPAIDVDRRDAAEVTVPLPHVPDQSQRRSRSRRRTRRELNRRLGSRAEPDAGP
jgi:hypothetical protein